MSSIFYIYLQKIEPGSNLAHFNAYTSSFSLLTGENRMFSRDKIFPVAGRKVSYRVSGRLLPSRDRIHLHIRIFKH